MTNFLYWCILIIPWVILPMNKIADPFRLPKAMFFDLMCLAIITISFIKGTRFYYKNKYLGFFLIWVFITFFFNWFLPYSVTQNNRQLINIFTLEPMLHLILAVIASFLVMSTLDKEDFKKLTKAFCISATLVTAWGIMQLIGFDPFGKIAYYNHSNKFSACLDNPNIMGNYLCLAFPFFFALKEPKYKLMGLLVFAGIILSKSVLSIGVAFASIILIFLFMQRKNKLLWILMIFLVILMAVFVLQNINLLKISSGFSGRIDVWKQALIHFKENPLFGQGLGSFKTFELKTVGTLVRELHNDWFERGIELGIIGLSLMILVVINSLRNFNYRQSDNIGKAYLISFISFLLLMLGSFPMEIAPVALTGLISFCAVERT